MPKKSDDKIAQLIAEIAKQGKGQTAAEDKAKEAKILKEAKPVVGVNKVAANALKNNNNVADLTVFRAVAEHMFRDPAFRSYVEQHFGVILGKSMGIYLRTVGFIIEVIFGTWFVTKGIFKILSTFTKFIVHIVYYAVYITIFLLHGLLWRIPKWIFSGVEKTAKKRRKTIQMEPVEPEPEEVEDIIEDIDIGEAMTPRRRSRKRSKTRRSRKRTLRKRGTTLLITMT